MEADDVVPPSGARPCKRRPEDRPVAPFEACGAGTVGHAIIGPVRREREISLPKVVAKPWGYELWYAHTDSYAGKILHVDRGHRLSLQYHEYKDESCYLLSGRLLLTRGPNEDELQECELGPGSIWRNLPGQIHTMEALEDSDVLEVSTPELDDVVRISDPYGRDGTTAA
jgi:quercetin dioxygenase-like cupin family protein